MCRNQTDWCRTDSSEQPGWLWLSSPPSWRARNPPTSRTTDHRRQHSCDAFRCMQLRPSCRTINIRESGSQVEAVVLFNDGKATPHGSRSAMSTGSLAASGQVEWEMHPPRLPTTRTPSPLVTPTATAAIPTKPCPQSSRSPA